VLLSTSNVIIACFNIGGILVSEVHIRRISLSLEKKYKDLIDIEDCKGKSDEIKDNAFLSRSLAAYTLTQVAKIEDEIAARCVVDSFDDNGIDAIYFDRDNYIFYVVQSKWRKSGEKSPTTSEIKKSIDGFGDLLNAKFDRFNDKVAKMEDEIFEALYDSKVRFVLVVVYTGRQPLSRHSIRHLEDMLQRYNEGYEMLSYKIYGLKELNKAISEQVQGDRINLIILLKHWGRIDEPFVAYYGQVEASDIASWWDNNSNNLFAPNLRMFLGSTEINDSIIATLDKSPEKFWYFNNGITILCSRILKKPIGGDNKDSGVFECEGVSIVNGAQTVGSIAKSRSSNPQNIQRARVLVRIISLENCPEGFATEVTRATNTQNKIQRRDFVSLDPEQRRLQEDLLLLHSKKYTYKTGEKTPSTEEGCDVDEATVALACANDDLGLAVQAKREIGKLWEDINKPPYKSLFNSDLSATRLWRAIEISRIVENELKKSEVDRQGRERLISVHGNRFILQQVFKKYPNFDKIPDIDFEHMKDKAPKETLRILDDLITAVEDKLPNSYPANIFKNRSKCLELEEYLKRLEG